MSQTDTSMLPSTRRAIPLRGRADLRIRRIEYQGIGSWVVKDPVALKYHRLQPEQYCVYGLLDGTRNLEEIRQQLLNEFPTLHVTLADVQHLITDLHQKGLVQSLRYGQGATLQAQRIKNRRKRVIAAARNLLYLRLPGWDPERCLTWLHPYVAWLFRPWAVFACVAMVAASLVLITIEFAEFRTRLPEFHQFFTWPNLMYLWLTLSATKILHEFGHGMSCNHFGGECHEMGVMLLVFSPCLYCDVSDSWMMRSKWQRIIIGAAGMYVETVLSAVAIFVWWNTRPGLLNHLCLNVFFVSTVTTVIFNANPLMRYDGYYMLADFLEIPNLRPKADKLLADRFAWYCLGIEQRPDPFMPETGRAWFVIFAIASGIYRWVILFGITLFLYTVLKPYDLQSIGIALAVASITGIIWNLAYNVYRIITAPRTDPMDYRKVGVTTFAVALLAIVAVFVPLPFHVETVFTAEPTDGANVYATTPGRMTEVRVAPGARVAKGDLLAKLTNPEKEGKHLSLKLERSLQQKEIDLDRALEDRAQEQVALAMLEGIERQIADYERELSQLEIRAPCDGVVVALPRIAEPKHDDVMRQLGRWYGTPLDPKNLGCYLTERTLLLTVAPTETCDAILFVDQGDRDDVRVGQEAEIKLEHAADRTYRGVVEKISDRESEFVPEALSNKAGGELPTVTDQHGHERLTSSAYQATVRLDQDANLIRPGMRGRARFVVERRSAADWIWRYFRRTFHFRL